MPAILDAEHPRDGDPADDQGALTREPNEDAAHKGAPHGIPSASAHAYAGARASMDRHPKAGSRSMAPTSPASRSSASAGLH